MSSGAAEEHRAEKEPRQQKAELYEQLEPNAAAVAWSHRESPGKQGRVKGAMHHFLSRPPEDSAEHSLLPIFHDSMAPLLLLKTEH